jgi:glyoxylase-like metal-dependent hydrolase (beta-lactamase superfamily II)
MSDTVLAAAVAVVEAARLNEKRLAVRSFFDEATFTATHVVYDPATNRAAIIDSVLDFEPASGRTSHASADAVISYVNDLGLTVDWLFETHAHADHLSAAAYLQEQLGGTLVISRKIITVQQTFGKLFNEPENFACDGSQFGRLMDDGERFEIGDIPGIALHVPGHTPACLAYVIGDAVFVGDTLFMPDFGSARADFPGGNARTLFRSIRRLLALPVECRVFLCHDYKAPRRNEYVWETTIGAERASNVHVHDGINEEDFVAMREARDATLGMPRLILPSIQVNMRGGHLPPPEDNGVSYLKLPLNLM